MLKRSRLFYVLLTLLTVALGLASRRPHLLPLWLAKPLGDVLYAVMAFWLVGLLFPRLSGPRTALGALSFCVGIEFLKLAQSPWLIAVRHSRWGPLVFGVGFHGANLACYALGVLLAWGLERKLRARLGVRYATAGSKSSVRTKEISPPP